MTMTTETTTSITPAPLACDACGFVARSKSGLGVHQALKQCISANEQWLLGALQGGPRTRDELVAMLGMPRTTVLSAWRRLVKKGLAMRFMRSRPAVVNVEYLDRATGTMRRAKRKVIKSGRGRRHVLFALVGGGDA